MEKKVVEKKAVVSLAIVVLLMAIFAWCMVTAMQLLEPRDMPFGVVGTSPVVSAVQEKDPDALDIITYASQDDLTKAAEQGDIYGGYIPGDSTDTLVAVPAKSFFGEVYVRGVFTDVAKQSNHALTTTVIAPLPISDRMGGVSGLLMLPTFLGGYLIASMLFTFTKRAAVRGRIAIILGFSVVAALITGLVAVLTGAVPTADIWKLLPCFVLVTVAVALTGTVFQQLSPKFGSLLFALLFIFIGGSGSGGIGVSLLPRYWQIIGALFPPRHAVELYRNVRYFDGHNIVTPIVVLAAYALIAAAAIVIIERRHPADQAAPEAAGAAAPAQNHGLVPKTLWAPIGLAVLFTSMFAANYMSSGHEPIAENMPFGVVGSSPLVDAAQGPNFSLDVTEYADESAATQAMDEGKIYGALIPGDSTNQLTVVPSMSDIAPLDLASNFEEAAKSLGETVTVKAYTPTPLAPKDPFGLVISIVLVPMLIAGYISVSMLSKALGTASGKWYGVWLLGFAVVMSLVLDLLVTYGLDGLPTDAFWTTWPIMALIILSVAALTAVLRRLVGPLGIFLAVIVVIQFGNPSSGGANGVPYLPDFWRSIGPFLPPRNAYLLLRNSVYFDRNGISQPLTVLLAYTLIAAVLLFAFDWFIDKPRSTPVMEDAADSAAAAAPVGVAP